MKRVVVVMCAVALLAAGSAGAGEATPGGPQRTLKVGMVTDVDLLREVPPDCALQCLALE